MPHLIRILEKKQKTEVKETFLGEGFFNTVYLTEIDGRKVVIKRPKEGVNKKRWQDEINFAMKSLNDIQDLDAPVFIPKVLQKKANYVIEEYAAGEKLTSELYQSLPLIEQDKVAHDIAVFLNEMHQKSLKLVENKTPRTYFSDWRFDRNLDKITNQQINLLYINVSQVYNLKFVGQTEVFAHRDLHFENILYDKNTQKVSIIDFGQMRKDTDIYEDFAPTVFKPIGLPWDLTKKIVENYNQLEKKTPIFIDINLVRDMQLAQLFTTFGQQDEVYDVYKDPNIIPPQALKAASDLFEQKFKPVIMERLADRPSDGNTTPEMRYRPYLFQGKNPHAKDSR